MHFINSVRAMVPLAPPVPMPMGPIVQCKVNKLEINKILKFKKGVEIIIKSKEVSTVQINLNLTFTRV